MDLKEHEKRIEHLKQRQITALAISVINRILIEQGLITKEQLQERFLQEMREKGWQKKEV